MRSVKKYDDVSVAGFSLVKNMNLILIEALNFRALTRALLVVRYSSAV